MKNMYGTIYICGNIGNMYGNITTCKKHVWKQTKTIGEYVRKYNKYVWKYIAI